MGYIHFTEQQKQDANNTDIAMFLQTQGESVKRTGREQVWQAPSGKVSISGSQWYSQYEQTGGGAILFVRKFFGMTFPEAVSKLLGESGAISLVQTQKNGQQKERKPFVPPQKNSDMRRVYGYLMNERHIDREIISAFVHAGLLYEDSEHHNAVFVGLNEDGEVKHIHKRSTVPASSFKNNIDSSIAEYSFHWVGDDNKLYVFEAPIDMLAYISLHKDNWQHHSYVALCSTADRAMIQMLKSHPSIDSVHLCLDHDDAGIEGAYRLAESIRTLEKEYSIWRVFSKNKDWDEDLRAMNGKEAIPSSKHKKQEMYTAFVQQAFSELQEDTPKIESKDVASKFKGNSLLSLIRCYLTMAVHGETDETKIGGIMNAGKTIIVGYAVAHRDISLNEIQEILCKKYLPHHDYDSIDRLSSTIETKLAALEKKIGGKCAYTAEAWNTTYDEFLDVAVDCFRQCGNIQRESEVQTTNNELVYS